MQANTLLDALGDHSKLYIDNDQAERQQRKFSREQASPGPDDAVPRNHMYLLLVSQMRVSRA